MGRNKCLGKQITILLKHMNCVRIHSNRTNRASCHGMMACSNTPHVCSAGGWWEAGQMHRAYEASSNILCSSNSSSCSSKADHCGTLISANTLCDSNSLYRGLKHSCWNSTVPYDKGKSSMMAFRDRRSKEKS